MVLYTLSKTTSKTRSTVDQVAGIFFVWNTLTIDTLSANNASNCGTRSVGVWLRQVWNAFSINTISTRSTTNKSA